MGPILSASNSTASAWEWALASATTGSLPPRVTARIAGLDSNTPLGFVSQERR